MSSGPTLLPVNLRVTGKADSCGELSTAASQVKGLVSVYSAAEKD